ncbi:MAG: hypothetical protein RLN81_16255 [Balneolaceae bacterium]
MKLKPILLLLTALITSSVAAQEAKNAIGADLIGSDISARFYINENTSIRADLGFVLLDVNQVDFQLSYVAYKSPEAFEVRFGTLRPYFAPGILLSADDITDDLSFGLIFPGGLEYIFEEAPVEVFMDIGPYVFIETNQLLGLSSSFGLRLRL